MPEHRWKSNSICRYLPLRDDNQVLWILGFLIILFVESLPPLNILHSIEIRMKIVCAYVHPTLRASPCAWHRKVRTEFPSKGVIEEQELSGVQIAWNIGYCKRSVSSLSPKQLCHTGLTLRTCYLHCYREPIVPSISLFKPIYLANCHAAPLLSAATWLISTASKLTCTGQRLTQTERQVIF